MLSKNRAAAGCAGLLDATRMGSTDPGMASTTYRIRTKGGLSGAYTLDRLRKERASGELDDATVCTSDHGVTWLPVGDVLKSGNESGGGSAGPCVAASEDSQGTHSDSTVGETDVISQDGRYRRGQSFQKLSRADTQSGDTSATRYLRRSQHKPGASDNQTAAPGHPAGYDPLSLIGASLINGRYRITSQLGTGSMAYVFRAIEQPHGRAVVVKVPKPDKIADRDFRDRFHQETQLLRRLKHPHIVRILDVGEVHDLPFVVMQLLSGGTLADRWEALPRPTAVKPASLKSWLPQVACALDFVNRQNIIHRDVKPANILFDQDDTAFIGDFGLTKIMHGDHTDLNSSHTAAGYVIGTPNYIAPEIVLGEAYDGRADQYSLGITVYQALHGAPPMQGNSTTATMVNQTRRQLPLLSDVRTDVSTRLARAIQRSIAKRPDRRFASCTEFADAVLLGLKGSTHCRPESEGRDAHDVVTRQNSPIQKRRRSGAIRARRNPSMPASTPDVEVRTELPAQRKSAWFGARRNRSRRGKRPAEPDSAWARVRRKITRAPGIVRLILATLAILTTCSLLMYALS